jgi:hypothetical protein
MTRDHYKGAPKRRNVVVRNDNLLDVEGIVRPSIQDNTPITASGLAVEAATRLKHVAVVDAGTLKIAGASAPTLVEHGSMMYMSFDSPGDRGFRVFKIDYDYVDNASLHIHWTKSDDVDRSGTFCRWRVDYSVYNGKDEEVNGLTFTETLDLEYLDSGTTTRYIYRSPNLTLSGIQAGYYVAAKITSTTASGAALVDPGLVSMDFMYLAHINRQGSY